MNILSFVIYIKLSLTSKKLADTLFLFLVISLSFVLSHQVAYANCVYKRPPAESYGTVLKSFKTMTINVYGQSISGVKDFITTTDGPCQDRLREIGEHIRDARVPYDIVGLQEWHRDTAATCNGIVLKNRIDDIYSKDHYKWAHPKAYDQNDGGLGVISKTPFIWENYSEDQFGSLLNGETHTETKNVLQFTPRFNRTIPFISSARTAHGFVFARIYLSRNPDIAVDTYVVHLTSTGSGGSKCNLQCKRGMLEQLREGIHKRSGNSGFPVLVMGDFNIGGPFDIGNSTSNCHGNDGYQDIMNNLGNPKDLWLEVGNTVFNRERSYTYISSKSGKIRIDYMFVPSDPYLVNSPYVITHKNPNKMDRVQLSNSDHKALIAELDIRKKKNIELRSGFVTIQQKSTGRYLDAHENEDNDFRLVTRRKQKNNTQIWQVTSLGNNLFSLRQKSNMRFVDAHNNQQRDFSLVSRPAQNNDTQRWIIKPIGSNLFTIQQKINGRFMDAHEAGGFNVVTRTSQNNNTQRWVIKPIRLVNKM